MIKISTDDIINLNIDPLTCVEWAKEAFMLKSQCQLPPKISLHPQGIDFFNTMPCLLPFDFHTYSCKIVSRIKGNVPPLKSELFLFDTRTGEMTAAIDADWITSWRTGAVATLAFNTLRKEDTNIISIIGLGTIAHTVMECLVATNKDRNLVIRLMKYKDQAGKFIKNFINNKNLIFEIVDSTEEFVKESDVIISCITETTDLIVKDLDLFKEGVLILPVHTRGFQNCDTVFDKIFADDEAHVKGFKYFNQFRKFGEIADVLNGSIPGRENDEERILSYNVGIGIHDAYFAYKIANLISSSKQIKNCS